MNPYIRIIYIHAYIFYDTVNGPFQHVSFPTDWDSDASSCVFKQLHHRHLTVRLCFKTTAESSCSALRSKDRQRAAGTFAAGWWGFFFYLSSLKVGWSWAPMSTERIAAVTVAARAGDSAWIISRFYLRSCEWVWRQMLFACKDLRRPADRALQRWRWRCAGATVQRSWDIISLVPSVK